MKGFIKAAAAALGGALVFSALAGCSNKTEPTPAAPQDFRVTAYVVSNRLGADFDSSNLSRVTDVILFGNATFDEEGEITLADSFESDAAFLQGLLTGQRFYLNILGPAAQTQFGDWTAQMHDLADRHTAAFESGVLENEIINVLEKYGFDGVVFDYEFPLRSKDWKAYDKFIISLDSVLGGAYKIGMSMVGWNLKQSKEAMAATDFFEVMSYDLWDNDGNHATMEIAQDDIEKFVKKGYDKAKLDLGLPFYARPTTREAYWYDYGSYCGELDDSGLYYDEEMKLTFSFNTYGLIKEKTEYALQSGLGGVMVWNYSSDAPADNALSLFGAIDSARQAAINF